MTDMIESDIPGIIELILIILPELIHCITGLDGFKYFIIALNYVSFFGTDSIIYIPVT